MRQKSGKTLFVILALSLALNSATACASAKRRKSDPPPMPVCIGDGEGGADCATPQGDAFYKDAASLKDWWMTDADSMARFMKWAYGKDYNEVIKELTAYQNEVRKNVQHSTSEERARSTEPGNPQIDH